MFTILKKSSGSRARLGRIDTPHGVVDTPGFVVVGTRGSVRCLDSDDLERTKTQLIIANTYHLWRMLDEKGLDAFPGLHAYMNWNRPLMTDSGGYQVFSFGYRREHGMGKVAQVHASEPSQGFVARKNRTTITDNGVWFEDDGAEYFLGPDESMRIQEQLGADIIFAFDECTSPAHDYAYVRRSIVRTYAWERRCLEVRSQNDQLLYGIVQGGVFEDLRRMSAAGIGALPFDGFGIGGSFGEREMREVIRWSTEHLPEEKPKHLLGIGGIKDIFIGVEEGMDTFDCVIPTREARHGRIWTKSGHYDVLRGKWRDDTRTLEEGCACPACASGCSRSALHRLFKEKNAEAGRLASLHNVSFFNRLFAEIRAALQRDTLEELKREYAHFGL